MSKNNRIHILFLLLCTISFCFALPKNCRSQQTRAQCSRKNEIRWTFNEAKNKCIKLKCGNNDNTFSTQLICNIACDLGGKDSKRSTFELTNKLYKVLIRDFRFETKEEDQMEWLESTQKKRALMLLIDRMASQKDFEQMSTAELSILLDNYETLKRPKRKFPETVKKLLKELNKWSKVRLLPRKELKDMLSRLDRPIVQPKGTWRELRRLLKKTQKELNTKSE